jgi:hypothetical protein
MYDGRMMVADGGTAHPLQTYRSEIHRLRKNTKVFIILCDLFHINPASYHLIVFHSIFEDFP